MLDYLVIGRGGAHRFSLVRGALAGVVVLALAGRALAQEDAGADTSADADAGADADAVADAGADAVADDADLDAAVDARPAAVPPPAAPVPAVTPKEDPEKPEAHVWSAFAPTDVFFATGIGPRVFASSTQMVLPTMTGVRSTLHLLPRVSLGEHLQLRVRWSLGYEWMAPDSAAAAHEVEPSDVVPSLWFPSIPTIPVVGIKAVVAIQFGLPTSRVAQAKTMYVAPAVVLQLLRDFRGVGSKDGSLRFVLNTSYVHPFYQYTTGAAIAPGPYGPSAAAAPYGSADTCFAFGGQADNPDATCGLSTPGVAIENLLGLNLAVVGRWWRLSPGVSFLLNNAWVYKFPDRPGVVTLPGYSNHRASAVASTWLDFEIMPWLTAEMGFQIAGGMLSSRGDFTLFGSTPDYRLYWGINLGIDRLARALAAPRRAPAPAE